MRPVLLEMNGFASFREPATVDFTDADFFALVGPTGAGKSTVIDAMTFALYGSVPRWGHKGLVRLALAPTVARGTVKLVFTSGGARYVVARELRRIGTQVSQRAASLERLADPAGLARPGEPTDVLAKDPASVTAEVSKLLGLSFDDFCQCVVLPQGKFADFLHANPRDRQDILLRLLGAEHYRQMMVRANQRANEAANRAETLGETLATFADATQEALDDAVAAQADLAALAGRVSAALPLVRAAGTELGSAMAELARVEAERTALAAVRVPPSTAVLDADLAAARTALGTAGAAARSAEDADRDAREALAGGPRRAPLELAAERRAELRERTGRSGELTAALAGLAGRTAQAEQAEGLAAQAVEKARADRDQAGRDAEAADQRAGQLRREHDALASVSVPEAVAGLDEEHQEALAGQREADRLLAAAEQADADARAACSAAVAAGPAEQAVGDLTEVQRLVTELPAVQARLAKAAAGRAQADAALDAAVAAQRDRQRELDEARRADVVADLRPHLVAGEPCPVCEQVVGVPPAALPAAELDQAQAGLDEAAGVVAKATAQARAAGSERDRVAAELTGADEQRARRLASVAAVVAGPLAGLELPATSRLLRDTDVDAGELADAVRAAIAELSGWLRGRKALDVAAAETAEAAAAARATARRAQDQLDQLGSRLAAGRAALSAARDPLVTLGAPPADAQSLGASWLGLMTWAREQALDRAAGLTAATEAARTTAAALAAAQADLVTAAAAADKAQAEARTAAGDEKEATTRLAEQAERIEQLAGLLRDAPDDEQISAQLAQLTDLELAARQAGAELSRARAARSGAEQALASLERAEAAARTDLSAARDQVVALGAPALDSGTDGLLVSWRTLAAWAAEQAAARALAAQAAQETVTERQSALVKLSGQLSADLVRHGLDLAADAVAGQAEAVVAAARERANAATARITERREQAAVLAARRGTAIEEQQVAKMLGDMLRSDRFPRWLVTAAVDVLVADASANLASLSDGQFDLAHEDGEFFVIDHADADSRRSVRTLSGGETFQASLALALALSAQLSALAAAGPARLDSIFLDEGFGTLDPDTLEVVATTLETLAQDQRMVGIITHVQALADRVPVRFAVSRDARSSAVVREGLAVGDAA